MIKDLSDTPSDSIGPGKLLFSKSDYSSFIAGGAFRRGNGLRDFGIISFSSF
jgi:hypothetical protein